MTKLTVAALIHYPVKSLAGIALTSAEITSKGIKGDREWMVVKQNGKMLTQRQAPKMVTIQPKLSDRGLELHANGLDPILVEEPTHEDAISVSIHGDKCEGYPASAAVNEWLTQAIGWETPLTLVKYTKQTARTPGSPERFGHDATYFADAAPFLIANTASLAALNSSLSEQKLPNVDMRHFRPNIVLQGLPAFAEHELPALNIGDTIFKLVDHCQRCVMITVNPDTGENLTKAIPFKQLAELNPMPNNAKAPAFGVNAILHSEISVFTIQVGDTVAV